MSNRYKETEEEQRERLNADKARETWDSWIVDLEEKPQPDTCDMDDEDCDSCGS